MTDALSLNRRFTIERHARAIDSCQDIEELRRVARSLLTAWQLQAGISEQMAAERLGLCPPGPAAGPSVDSGRP